ncbi:regulator of chromosome condensation 1/beta-lactamase-inhibitor protein II, partial [Pelagophyceae sp. CCMP2097]
VACGLGHVLVLLEDGAVFAWGDGAHGRLGLGGLESRATPAKVLGIAKIASVGCGAAHSLAVSESGAGFAWG